MIKFFNPAGIILALAFLCPPVSQPVNCQWAKYTWKNTAGIQTSMINSIVQDDNDRIWFATDQGLDNYNLRTNIWSHYTAMNGLAGNFINRVFKDRDGSIWIATDYGISRLSKNVITNFTMQNGLASNQVRAIGQTPNGTLLFGTFGGGVCSYNPGSGFKKIPLKSKDSCILSILALSDTAMLIGTFNRGLVLFQNDSAYSINNPQDLKGKIIYSLLRTRGGEIWVGTDQGAQQYNYAENRVLPCPDSLAGKTVYSINENDSNDLILGTFGELFQLIKGTWTSFVPDNLVKPASYYSLLFDSNGALWVGTSSRGLFIREGQSWTDSKSLGPHDIGFLSICEGKNHVMWFASYDYLYSYDGNLWNKVPLPDRETEYDGLLKIACDTAGTVWCLRNSWKIYNYNGESWKAYTGPGDFDGVSVTSIESDPYGNVWFAACNSGVFRFNGKSWSHYKDYSSINYNSPELLCYDDMAFYPDGKLITTDSHANLSFFDGTDWSSSDLMKEKYGINDMTTGPDNTILFGTNNGLIKYNDGQIKSILDGVTIISIGVDQYGHIWAGDWWNGLKWFDGRTWQTITTADGLASNWISDIFFDSRGRTWLATDKGINMSDNNVTRVRNERNGITGISASPNPFSDVLNLQYYSNKPGDAVIQFISQDGRVIRQITEHFQAGNNFLQYNTANWPEGITICIINQNGSISRQKLVKIQ